MNPVIVPREAHTLSRKLIDPEALKVLYGLQRAGFRAFLCGGGVRDLLLGLAPKDFDVVTDARPEQVRRAFRNCRIIGRRFRLAHVFFKEKIIEVSTFRRRAPASEEGEDLLITDDNVFGTPEEDALRRDFTVNGLFYDIATFAIIDYAGGLADLRDRLIRSIGEPSVRFREDPVRMLRAVKMAARLNFDIDIADWEAIRGHAQEINRSAAPRLLDELLKILHSGASERAFRLLEGSGVMDALLPELRHALEEARAKETGADFELYRLLSAMDRLKEEGRTLDGAVAMGAILLPWLGPSHFPAGRNAAEKVRDRMEPLRARLHIGRRDSQMIRNILVLQQRFQFRWDRRSQASLMRRRAFPLAIDLAEIRARSRGVELPRELLDLRAKCEALWDRRGKRIALLPGEEAQVLDPPKRRRKRRRRGSEAAEARPSDRPGRAPRAAAPEGGDYAMVPPALSLPSEAGGVQPSTDGAGGRRRRRRRRGGRQRGSGGEPSPPAAPAAG